MEGSLSGVALCRRAPSISHLFFADDSLLFGKATREEGQKRLSILQVYEETSGQKVNLAKTGLFFSKNTHHTVREELANLIGVTDSSVHDNSLCSFQRL